MNLLKNILFSIIQINFTIFNSILIKLNIEPIIELMWLLNQYYFRNDIKGMLIVQLLLTNPLRGFIIIIF